MSHLDSNDFSFEFSKKDFRDKRHQYRVWLSATIIVWLAYSIAFFAIVPGNFNVAHIAILVLIVAPCYATRRAIVAHWALKSIAQQRKDNTTAWRATVEYYLHRGSTSWHVNDYTLTAFELGSNREAFQVMMISDDRRDMPNIYLVTPNSVVTEQGAPFLHNFKTLTSGRQKKGAFRPLSQLAEAFPPTGRDATSD